MKNEISKFNDQNFKTIRITLVYPFPKKRKDLAFFFLLPSVLSLKTKKYPTEEKFSNASIDNYTMNWSVFSMDKANMKYIIFNIVIPDPEVLQDPNYNIKKTIAFVIDSIYNPLIVNNEFNAFDLEKIKTEKKIYLASRFKNIDFCTRFTVDSLIDDTGYFKDNIFDHQYLIDKVNGANLYDFYKQVIGNRKPWIFVGGNNVNDEIINIIDKSFPKDLKIPSTKKIENQIFVKNDKKVKRVNEQKNYNQSILYLAYKIKNYNLTDYIILELIKDLLYSSPSAILNKMLREENQLVYKYRVTTYNDNGVLFLSANIHQSKKDLTLDLMLKAMEKLTDEEYIKPLLTNIIDKKENDLKKVKDYPHDLFHEYVDLNLNFEMMSLEEEFNVMKTITPLDIKKFVKRLELDVIYFMEGVQNER